MPYDPRMLQMARQGIGMMAPQQPPFDRAQQQPKQWWEQPMPSAPAQSGENAGAQSPQDDPSKPKQPPSLLDMMMNLGRMSRPQYDRAMQGPGAYGVAPKDAAALGPWGWLGSLGGGPPR